MCHVLIIEDDGLIAECLAELIESAGATSTAHACTEQDAVRSAQARAPKVIISDVNLLEGTGPAAVMSIRAVLGPIPVIYITSSPHACEQCDQPRVILLKPARAALIIDAFEQFASQR